jgi:hypothetical protein
MPVGDGLSSYWRRPIAEESLLCVGTSDMPSTLWVFVSGWSRLGRTQTGTVSGLHLKGV